MGLYRLSVSIVSRGNTGRRLTTRNVVAAAAYQTREPIYDERQREMRYPAQDMHDLVHAEVLLPETAPMRWLDRGTLWNEVDAAERRKDAVLARMLTLTLPRELRLRDNIDLAREYLLRSFVERGMVADLAVHSKMASDGRAQPHAHALLTTRRIVDGAFGLKERAWKSVQLLRSWREEWAETANRRLAEHGLSARLDHRRWIAAGIRALGMTQGQRDDARRRPMREVSRAAVRAARRVVRWLDREREPVSEREAAAAFRAALVERGLRPSDDPVMDGRFHRVPVEGDRAGQRSGSYLGYLDGRPAGYIHNFRTGEAGPWRAEGIYVVPDPAKLEAERAARREQTALRQAAAADRAAKEWLRAGPAREHPYLAEKGVSGEGLRVSQRGDLLVPLRDVQGRMWGVQRITQDGEKLFGRGQRTHGTHMLLGELRPHEPLIVAEGYATAASIHAATGRAVAAAMNAGNLEAVARAYRERNPGREIVIAADNDHHLPMRDPPLANVGVAKAAAAAAAVGGRVVVPGFALGDAGTDWNDFAKLHGIAAVRGAFEREGVPVERMRTEAAAVSERRTTQAERDRARQAMPQMTQALRAADQEAQLASRRAQEAATLSHELTL